MLPASVKEVEFALISVSVIAKVPCIRGKSKFLLNLRFTATYVNMITVNGYFLTQTNNLCEKNAVFDLETCKSAVDEIKKAMTNIFFDKVMVDSDYPKGCFMFGGRVTGRVIFNEHAAGSRNGQAQQICIKRGKE